MQNLLKERVKMSLHYNNMTELARYGSSKCANNEHLVRDNFSEEEALEVVECLVRMDFSFDEEIEGLKEEISNLERNIEDDYISEDDVCHEKALIEDKLKKLLEFFEIKELSESEKDDLEKVLNELDYRDIGLGCILEKLKN